VQPQRLLECSLLCDSAALLSVVSAATPGISGPLSECLTQRLPEGGSGQVCLVVTQYESTIIYS
jgi:hypothetical protein